MLELVAIGEAASGGFEEFTRVVPWGDGEFPGLFDGDGTFKLIDIVVNTIMAVNRQISTAIVRCGRDIRRLATFCRRELLFTTYGCGILSVA